MKRLQEIEPEFREVEEENRKRPGRLMNAQRGLTRLDVDWRAYNK